MKLKQLHAFREVMRTGSVSEAARRLFRTQPAISSLIGTLEKDLGYQLFIRRGGRLHPVPEAYYLYEEAGEVLGRLDMVEQTMKSVRDFERGEISIVSMPGPSVFLLPTLIGKFVDGRKDVKVTLTTRNSNEVHQLVSVQQYDIGLGDLEVVGAELSPLVKYDIVRLECVCGISINDPLAQKREITPKDLDGRPMATLYSDHPSFIQTKAAFDEMRASFKPQFETQYFIPLFTFIERGLASSVVDPWSAISYSLYNPTNPKVVFRPFSPTVLFTAAIMTPSHRPLSNIANAFAEELRGEIRRISVID